MIAAGLGSLTCWPTGRARNGINKHLWLACLEALVTIINQPFLFSFLFFIFYSIIIIVFFFNFFTFYISIYIVTSVTYIILYVEVTRYICGDFVGNTVMHLLPV